MCLCLLTVGLALNPRLEERKHKVRCGVRGSLQVTLPFFHPGPRPSSQTLLMASLVRGERLIILAKGAQHQVVCYLRHTRHMSQLSHLEFTTSFILNAEDTQCHAYLARSSCSQSQVRVLRPGTPHGCLEIRPNRIQI